MERDPVILICLHINPWKSFGMKGRILVINFDLIQGLDRFD